MDELGRLSRVGRRALIREPLGDTTPIIAVGPHRGGATARSVKVPFVGVLCMAFIMVALFVGWLTIRNIAAIRADLIAERDGYRDRMLENLRAMSDIGNDPRTLAEMAEAQEVLCDQAYDWAVVGAPMWDKIKELVLTSQWLDTRNPNNYGDLIDAAS